MIRKLKEWWLERKLRRATRWTERYIRPDTLERWTPPQEQGLLSREDIRAAMRKIKGDNSPVINTGDGFDGMTVVEQAAWMVAYQQWLDGRGPSDAELVAMSTEDFQRFVEAKRQTNFVPVPWNGRTGEHTGLITPAGWLEERPDQGLIVGMGINLRRLGEAYQRMESGAELTPYDREIIAMRPDLNLGAINRQLRAIGKPEIRAVSPDQKEIL